MASNVRCNIWIVGIIDVRCTRQTILPAPSYYGLENESLPDRENQSDLLGVATRK